MKDKDWKRHYAYEALVILCVVAALTFICRLWPILLLVLLGIVIAALRLLFLSSKKVTVVQPAPLPASPKQDPTERDVRDMAYSVILRRVTELVCQEYPEAKWVWEAPNTRKLIEQGEPVTILLNKAGGYRRALVQIRNLQVAGVSYTFDTEKAEDSLTEPVKENPTDTPAEPAEEEKSEDTPENYELLAFEWVETHIMDLNDRCNEVIGQGQSELLLEPDELPIPDSWPAICEELKRAGLEEVTCSVEGIRINLMQ